MAEATKEEEEQGGAYLTFYHDHNTTTNYYDFVDGDDGYSEVTDLKKHASLEKKKKKNKRKKNNRKSRNEDENYDAIGEEAEEEERGTHYERVDLDALSPRVKSLYYSIHNSNDSHKEADLSASSSASKGKRKTKEEQKQDYEQRKKRLEQVEAKSIPWNQSFQQQREHYNARFQTLEQQKQKQFHNNNEKEGEEAEREERELVEEASVRLGGLAEGFTRAAAEAGKLILEELWLGVEPTRKDTGKAAKAWRVVPPAVHVGGIAGGEKYFACGIFFKLCLDFNGLYKRDSEERADELSMKVAGHEMKGLNSMVHWITSIPELHHLCYPLMTLIDYRGYRLLALAQLPINKSTICYGCCDGGRTVWYAIEEAIDREMRMLGLLLNLEGHWVWSSSGVDKAFIYGPGDVECHVGTDGRFYIVDTARMAPPAAMLPGSKCGFLYRLLRSEFVSNCGIGALCCDAYCRWGVDRDDPTAIRRFNDKVKEATSLLEQQVIPNFVKRICEMKSFSSVHRLYNADVRWLIILMHQSGINLRYLSSIRRQLEEEKAYSSASAVVPLLRSALFTEIVARGIKHDIRHKWRELRTSNKAAHKNVLTTYLNSLFFAFPYSSSCSSSSSSSSSSSLLSSLSSSSPSSTLYNGEFWRETVKPRVEDTFGKDVFLFVEQEVNEDGKEETELLDFSLLLERLQELLCFRLRASGRSKIKSRIEKGDEEVERLEGKDIEEPKAKVTPMFLVSLQEGYCLVQKADIWNEQRQGEEKGKEKAKAKERGKKEEGKKSKKGRKDKKKKAKDAVKESKDKEENERTQTDEKQSEKGKRQRKKKNTKKKPTKHKQKTEREEKETALLVEAYKHFMACAERKPSFPLVFQNLAAVKHRLEEHKSHQHRQRQEQLHEEVGCLLAEELEEMARRELQNFQRCYQRLKEAEHNTPASKEKPREAEKATRGEAKAKPKTKRKGKGEQTAKEEEKREQNEREDKANDDEEEETEARTTRVSTSSSSSSSSSSNVRSRSQQQEVAAPRACILF